jgi:hypothetical protein
MSRSRQIIRASPYPRLTQGQRHRCIEYQCKVFAVIIEDFGPSITIGYTFGTSDEIWEDIAADLLGSNQIMTKFSYLADGNLHAFSNTFTNGQALFEETPVTSEYWLRE